MINLFDTIIASKIFNKMKFTKLVLSVLLMIIVNSANSQDFDAKIIFGGTFSQVDGDAFGGYNKMGITTGIGIQRKLKNNWTAGFELLYSQKGSRKRVDPEDLNPQIFILKFNYLEMPLLASYAVGNFNFYGGPSIGFLIKGKRDTGLGYIDLKSDEVNKTEVGFKTGVSYDINENLAFQIAHSSSLLRIGNPYLGGVYVFSRNGLYNRLFIDSLSYKLGTKKSQ
jgi:hypothetical protein